MTVVGSDPGSTGGRRGREVVTATEVLVPAPPGTRGLGRVSFSKRVNQGSERTPGATWQDRTLSG